MIGDGRGARRLALCAALVGVAFGLGFLVAEHRTGPYQLLRRLERPLVEYLRARAEGRDASLRQVWHQVTGPVAIETTLLGLNRHRVDIPVAHHTAGGALARVGESLLLLTGAGEIFEVGPSAAHRKAIAVPDNGAAAYVALAGDEAFRQYSFPRLDFYQPRYHDLLYFQDGGKQGLLVSFTEWDDTAKCYANVVARLDLPAAADPMTATAGPHDWSRLFVTRPCLPLRTQGSALAGHVSGGRMALAGGGKLLLSTGYFGMHEADPARAPSQRGDNDYGKLLLVDIASGSYSTISIGHRNPQGVLVDAAGAIWSTEHGPRGGDELNRIVGGGNYGWPAVTLGVDIDGSAWPSAEEVGRHDAFTAPVYAWLPSVGVSNLIQLRGFHPAWDGDLLVATLAAKKLFRLRLEQGRVLLAEPVEVGVKGRYLQQHPDGRLALWSDSEAAVFFYTPVSLEPSLPHQ